MARPVQHADIEQTLLEAEQTGLKLAIKGRTIALILLAIWIGFSRSPDPQHAIEFVSGIAGFAALGGIHYVIIGTMLDRRWVKYVFITIDIAILSLLVATQPIYDSIDVPQAMAFRNTIFPYYFIALAVAAFSFSPLLVLWAGIAGVAGWIGAFNWSIRGMTETFDWTDVGSNPSTDHFLSVFLNVNWIGTGSRIQESVAFLLVAILIAIVMLRARRTVRRQLELDEERRSITDVFGQFVPKAIAEALISDRGVLEPVERDATILFTDIAGFTTMTEESGAQKIVRILNAYFDEVTQVITKYDGVITQFQGDAILATFNVPIEDSDHASKAYQAALEIRELVSARTFDGTHITTRVGVCTGPVVAGNVGGGGRQNYTVHGNTVNLAARLEALNKDYGTTLLIGQSTVTALQERSPNLQLKRIGEITVRGISKPVAVYTSDE